MKSGKLNSKFAKTYCFFSEEQIKKSTWINAEKLVIDVDPKDTPYIAFAKYFRCLVWSGDKELIKGLTKKGFNGFISTEELFQLSSK